ncbi:MAG: hypothetical protein E7157_01160 [Lactobacillales bacterium]|nr:hypothetical protein [Lactobacillales bacterium]
MEQNLIFTLNSLKFQEAIRDLFGAVNKFLYYCIAKFIDGMYKLANLDFGLGEQIDDFTSRIFVIMIIFMIFKLTLSVMNYLIDPDSFTDKSKGGGKLISRVIISVALLISINPIFNFLKDVQSTIINDDVVTNFILGSNTSINLSFEYEDNGEKKQIYSTRMSDKCDDEYFVLSFSKGDNFSVMALRPFYQIATGVDDAKEQMPNLYEVGYCGTSTSSLATTGTDKGKLTSEIITNIKKDPNNASELLKHKIYNSVSGDWDALHEEDFDIEFNYIWALVVGIVIVLMIISFCFDIVIRALTLFFYQLIAPIPIISYVSPKGKDSEMLGNWFKKLFSVWGSLFIRIGILDFVIYFTGIACNEIINNDNNTGTVMQIIVIIGTLMFAKKLPKLLEELIPGMKLDGGFELNPFKRIRKDAVGGDLLMNGIGRGLGTITGAAGGALAGAKAGREIGAVGKGVALGALSGAGTGFRNKKASFGKGMGESYKNLTGNEFRRMTPVSLLMPKMGKQPVQETKDYIKKGYEQLNAKNSDLNISESFSSQLATDLMAKGYDIKDINGMKSTAQSRIDAKKTSIDELKAKTSGIEAESNAAKQLYDDYQTQYSNAIQNQKSIQTNYDKCKNNMTNLDAEILKQEQLVGKGIGSFDMAARDRLEKLKNQRKTFENELNGYTTQLNNATSTIQSIKDNMDKAELDMNNKIEAYNTHIQKIESAESEIESYKVDIENIKRYEEHRKNEAEIRNDISSINKDIDTFKKEKAQRERFYRIDPAPQQDYGSAKSNVDERG